MNRLEEILRLAYSYGFAAAKSILLAIVFWIVGQWLINKAVNLITRGMERQKLDTTVVKYMASALAIILKVILIVSILGYFGIETTTFAALFAAIGIAIGAAWGGLLANLAAGAFLVFLKPYKVGDFVQAGEVVGTVKEIGLFVTTIDTMDNVRTYVGNNKVFSGNIQNFTLNPHRRVELVAQLNHGVDHNDAISRLREKVLAIPNVKEDPAPEIDILTFNLAGPVLSVRPYCHNDHYWQVYFATNKVIRETFGDANYPVPEQHLAIRNS